MNAEIPDEPGAVAEDAAESRVVKARARTAGETAAHLRLKHAAYCWALHQGYRCAALEVNLPNSSYRADVAAYRPQRRRVLEQDPVSVAGKLIVRDVLGTTAIFECKQSRADFLKDSREARAITAELARLAERREVLERQLKVHYPRLQRGDSLFPEYQTADLEHLEHAPYRRIMRRMENLHRQLYGQTKFDKIRRQNIANLYYLVVRPGILAPHEVPCEWGLLEVPDAPEAPSAEEGEPGAQPLEAVLIVQPTLRESRDHQRLGLLQRITQAAMRPMNRDCGFVHPASRERPKLVEIPTPSAPEEEPRSPAP